MSVLIRVRGQAAQERASFYRDNLWLGVQAINIFSLSKALRIPVAVGVLLKLVDLFSPPTLPVSL